MIRQSGSLATALALIGCATNPTAIKPTAFDHRPLMSSDCTTLATRTAATDAELRRYVSSQGNARVADALTWPIPTSRITGKNRRNVEAIGRLSGELEALKKAHTLKCESNDPTG
jgi:hypothetical protein